MLSAVSTFTALWSSWLLTVPARRAAALQGAIAVIDVQMSEDADTRTVQMQAIASLKVQTARHVGDDQKAIARGRFWMVISGLFFAAALLVQLTSL